MKVSLVYTFVCGRSDPSAPDPSYYHGYSKRFVETYRTFPSGIEHELFVCFCGGSPTDRDLNLFYGVAFKSLEYIGGGWDIGAYQSANSAVMDCDLAMFMAAPVYFVVSEWLVPFAEAFERFGAGLYGPQASYENHPHIRTGCFACSPAVLFKYPHLIDTREKCMHFESGGGNPDWNFTRWCSSKGYPAKLVLRDGFYDQPDWRSPANIFRRGDQSNLLIRDRHNDIYESSAPELRAQLERQAEGK